MYLDGKNLGNLQSVIVNDCIVIQKGKIPNNPFVKRLDFSKTAQWMIENMDIVMRRISFLFNNFKVAYQGGNIDDCFAYCVNYFTNSKSKAFNENYFGENNPNYNISNYCFANLKYAVISYRNSLQKLNTVSLATNVEAERFVGTVVEDTLIATIDTSLSIEDEIYYKDYEKFDSKFEWLEDYTYYFIDKNYKKFDIIGYLTYMFFDVKYPDDVQRQYKYVANKIGESKELIELVTNNFKKDVVNKNEHAEDLFDLILQLVGNMKKGWQPKLIRDNYNNIEIDIDF